MTGYSADLADRFDGIQWRQVLAMLSILRECDYTKVEYIRKRYARRASHFRETYAFMVCLRAVREIDGYVRPSDMVRDGDEEDASEWVTRRLFGTRNRYRTQILEYLRKFSIENGDPVYRPFPSSAHQKSHVRNCLMELGVLYRDADSACYRVSAQHIDLYVAAQDGVDKLAPSTVALAQRDRESLGTAAEEAILSYERKRVGSRFACRVQHVAIVNAAAGYDVRSVTINDNGMEEPRYIEVKAVSGSSLEFHWTRNEAATAKLLGQWYYLYLLPVTAGRGFAINELEIIPDPHASVLQAPDAWAVEPDVLRCHRR